MAFFDWIYNNSRKKLLQSYDEYWRRLKQYFSLFARRSMDKEVQEQMRRVRRSLVALRYTSLMVSTVS